MLPQITQLFPSQDNSILSWILNIVWIGSFVVVIFYGQRIQMYLTLKEVEGSLMRLKLMRDEGRKTAIATIKELGKPQGDPSARVEQFLEYVVLPPEAMDPAGIVWKLDQLLDVMDERFKDEVRLMAPAADESVTNNLENTLGAAQGLNIIYKTIRHYYLLGKKTWSLYIVMQLQMVLPLIMREAEAIENFLKASTNGQPIGDGVGALVAAKLMHGHPQKDITKDCVVAQIPFEGRRAYVLKAKGPGGNVGKPGSAISAIIEENGGKIALVIGIDAKGKLEGEKVGEIAEGVGVPIGGLGTESFKVEETVLKYKIPVYAVVIKEDSWDAYSSMRKEIVESVDPAIERVKRVVLERTKEGDLVIIAGVGNTIGIGQ